MILAATLVVLGIVFLAMVFVTVRNELPLWAYVLVGLAVHPLAAFLIHDTALGDIGPQPVMDWALSLPLIATGAGIVSILYDKRRKRDARRGLQAALPEDHEPDPSPGTA
jgi:cbb3-type cytochrome oxidase subunit 3